jgi:hypothetical protein
MLKAEHLAKEADRLKNDEIFNRALDDMRTTALDALAYANADDKTGILRLQQLVAAIDEIRTTLDRYIMAADVQETSGSFA